MQIEIRYKQNRPIKPTPDIIKNIDTIYPYYDDKENRLYLAIYYFLGKQIKKYNVQYSLIQSLIIEDKESTIALHLDAIQKYINNKN